MPLAADSLETTCCFLLSSNLLLITHELSFSAKICQELEVNLCSWTSSFEGARTYVLSALPFLEPRICVHTSKWPSYIVMFLRTCVVFQLLPVIRLIHSMLSGMYKMMEK